MTTVSKTSDLHLGGGLSLPVDAVTETFSLLGQRGSGKTHTASVLMEELLEQRQRVAIIDPVGVWWGLRSSRDGKGRGYPVVIFGGDHADLPLEPGAGELIADLLIDQHLACVIDLSLMRKAEQRTFMTAFTEALYHRNREAMHLVVDEADLYAGQRPPKGAERLLGAMEDLVRRGRARGIGVSLISQRPAVLHKDVLSQTSVLIALRMTGPQDRNALDAWISQHDIHNQRGEFLATLASLPTGTAWVWSPGALGLFNKVKVRQRRTYDSSATPKVGETRVAPKQYAHVDLGVLEKKMSALVERAQESDPKFLARKVRVLEAEIAKRDRADTTRQSKPETVTVVETKVERVEVPVLSDAHVSALKAAADELRSAGERSIEKADEIISELRAAQAAPDPLSRGRKPRQTPSRAAAPRYEPPAPRQTSVARDDVSHSDEDFKLRAGARRMLENLAKFYPESLTGAQLGALSKMRHTSGTFGTYKGELKRAGYIDAEGDKFTATEAGIQASGVSPADTPTTFDELRDMWEDRLRAGGRRMLDAVIASAPDPIHKEDVAAAADLSSTSGTFGTYFGELKRYKLIRVDGQEVTLGEAWDMVSR